MRKRRKIPENECGVYFNNFYCCLYVIFPIEFTYICAPWKCKSLLCLISEKAFPNSKYREFSKSPKMLYYI